MHVSVEVTDLMRREAEQRGLPIVDFVEMLVGKGMEVLLDNATVVSAIDRIRALRTPAAMGSR